MLVKIVKMLRTKLEKEILDYCLVNNIINVDKLQMILLVEDLR
jgi:hypothetical protein